MVGGLGQNPLEDEGPHSDRRTRVCVGVCAYFLLLL